MGSRNDLFRQKYNILDKLCRQKFNMFRTATGQRDNRSAILEFANTLQPLYQEKLKSIVQMRNLIEHEDMAEVNQKVINDLDHFISLVKTNNTSYQKPPAPPKPVNIDDFKREKLSKIRRSYRDLDLSVYDTYERIIKNICYRIENGIEYLEETSSLDDAKRISQSLEQYIQFLNNTEDYILEELDGTVLLVKNNLKSTYEDVMEYNTPDRKRLAKQVHRKYVALINVSHSSTEAMNLGDEALNELYKLR